MSRLLSKYGIPKRNPSESRPRNPYPQARYVLTPEALRRWVFDEELSVDEIERRTGFGDGTIAHYLRAAGLPAPVVGMHHLDPQVLARLRAEGWSQNRIGERFGVPTSTVSRTLRRAGLATRIDKKGSGSDPV